MAMVKLYLIAAQLQSLGLHNTRDVWCSVTGHVYTSAGRFLRQARVISAAARLRTSMSVTFQPARGFPRTQDPLSCIHDDCGDRQDGEAIKRRHL